MIPIDEIPEHLFPKSSNKESNSNLYLIALIPIAILLIAAIYIYSNKSTINENKQ